MRCLLAGLLILVFLIVGFMFWFNSIFMKLPKLKVDHQLSLEERISDIDGWLTKVEEAYLFNGAILIAKDGEVLLSKGYGYNDESYKTRVTENSSFRLASCSKNFTAAGIMLLKQKGKLEFDDAVKNYFTDFPYPKITIRNLLNQTSGLKDNYMRLAHKNKDDIEVLTIDKAMSLVIEEAASLKFQPNSGYLYSNVNYIFLAGLIEKLSGQSYETFMKEEFFTPLGMVNTRVWNLLSEEVDFENRTYDFSRFKHFDSKRLEPSFLDGVAGDGAVFSSANDLLIWDQFWYENDLIEGHIIQEALTNPILENGKESKYGFGWIIVGDVTEHDGAWLGANTYLYRDTKNHICIALLDNSDNYKLFDIASKLIKSVN